MVSRKKDRSSKSCSSNKSLSNKGSNELVIGGFRFSSVHDCNNGILVTSVDPRDTTVRVAVPVEPTKNNEGDGDNDISSHGMLRSRILKKRNRKEEKQAADLDSKALLFCRLANKILRKNNRQLSSFSGEEIIYKMVSSRMVRTRVDALALGKDLAKKKRLFYSVESKRHTFSDDDKRYKFRPEALLSVIMKTPMCLQTPTSSDEASCPGDFRKKPKKSSKKRDSSKKSKSISKLTGKPKKKGRRPQKGQPKKPSSASSLSSPKPPKRSKSSTYPSYGGQQSLDDPADFLAPSPMTITRTVENNSSVHAVNAEDCQSLYTEVTFSQEFPEPVTDSDSDSDDDDDDDSYYLELTVATAMDEGDSGSTYFEEYDDRWERQNDEFAGISTTSVVRKKITTSTKRLRG